MTGSTQNCKDGVIVLWVSGYPSLVVGAYGIGWLMPGPALCEKSLVGHFARGDKTLFSKETPPHTPSTD